MLKILKHPYVELSAYLLSTYNPIKPSINVGSPFIWNLKTVTKVSSTSWWKRLCFLITSHHQCMHYCIMCPTTQGNVCWNKVLDNLAARLSSMFYNSLSAITFDMHIDDSWTRFCRRYWRKYTSTSSECDDDSIIFEFIYVTAIICAGGL